MWEGYPPALARPNNTLVGCSGEFLPYAHPNGVEAAMPLQWNELTSDSVSELASVLSEETIETHIGATRYGEQRFVHVCNLE